MNRIAVGFTITLILVSLGLIYMVSQWELPQNQGNGELVKQWVLLQPTKCAEIPWRKEWAQLNQTTYAEFPVEQELTFARKYYEDRGITVFDISLTYQPVDSYCSVCGCPEPFAFAIQTYERDAARLIVSGFKVLDGRNPTVFTGPYYRQSSDNPLSTVKADECEKVFATHTFLDEWFGSKRDSCYIQAAIDAQNVQICSRVEIVRSRYTCITEVATALEYVELCDIITDIISRDGCIAGVASALQNKSMCNKIQTNTAKYFCILGTTPPAS